jgi:hypothetical protein
MGALLTADQVRPWLAGFLLASAVTVFAFAVRVSVGGTGLGDAVAIELLSGPATWLGTELSPRSLPVLVGFVEALAAGLVGACLAGVTAGSLTWRGRTFLILVVTLALQLLASSPINFG